MTKKNEPKPSFNTMSTESLITLVSQGGMTKTQAIKAATILENRIPLLNP